jgi:hypothetical protein
VERAKLVCDDLRDLQPAGVGTDVNGRKRGHEEGMNPTRSKSVSSAKIHDSAQNAIPIAFLALRLNAALNRTG